MIEENASLTMRTFSPMYFASSNLQYSISLIIKALCCRISIKLASELGHLQSNQLNI